MAYDDFRYASRYASGSNSIELDSLSFDGMMAASEAPPRYTVRELLNGLKNRLNRAAQLNGIVVRGEVGKVSEYGRNGRRSYYFGLKEGSEALINCVSYRDIAISEGDLIDARGKVDLYVARGDLKLIVDSVTPVGSGTLARQYERLRQQLQAEGLFAEAHKRQLPRYPRLVGVITSERGAVIHDICTTLGKRNPSVRILLAPSLVQGTGAADSLVAALHKLEALPEVDCIIIGRGGGSAEDLQAFNSEGLVRALFASPKPIISAVGHESDTTLCDYVADFRAATPTAAATAVSPERTQLLDELQALLQRGSKGCRRIYDEKRNQLNYLQASPRLTNHSSYIEERRQYVGELVREASRCATQLVEKRHQETALLATRLRACSPEQRIMLLSSSLTDLRQRLRALAASATKPVRAELAHWQQRLTTWSQSATQQRRDRLQMLQGQLNALSPQLVLERGYAIISSSDDHVLESCADLTPGRDVKLQMHDGIASARITARVDE